MSRKTMHPTSAGERSIRWECDICNEPITDGAGWITISHDAIREYEVAAAGWRFEVGEIYTGGELLLSTPRQVEWEVLHSDCDPSPERSDAFIPIAQARSYSALLAWTMHLDGKGYGASTSWYRLMRQVIVTGSNSATPTTWLADADRAAERSTP